MQMSFRAEVVRVSVCDNELDAAPHGGFAWVSILRACEVLGLNYSGQLQRLKRASHWATVCVMHTVAEDGKRRELAMLRADQIPMWMSGMDVNRLKPEVRAKIIQFQNEAADVLANHFFPKPAPPPTLPGSGDSLLDSITTLHHAVGALVELRAKQVDYERQSAETRQLAESANRTAFAALCQAESNHGHFTVLGYCRRTGRELTIKQAQQHGRSLSAICRDRNIHVGQMSEPRYGSVNTYPESLLAEYFDDVDRNSE